MSPRPVYVQLAVLSLGVATLLNAGCMTMCIAEGTAIATPQGPRLIEEIRVGDRVWSWSADGRPDVGTVRHVRTATVRRTLEFTFANGRTLRTTPSHPLMADGDWTNAEDVRVGDKMTAETPVRVTRIAYRHEPTRVFDLTVSPHANFFANGVLVHNKSFPRQPKAEELTGAWIAYQPWDRWIYRIELHPEGAGRAARTRIDHFSEEVETLRFDSWGLDKYDITIQLTSPQESPTTRSRELFFSGPARRDRLDLRQRSGGMVRSVIFVREDYLRGKLDDLRAEMVDGVTQGSDVSDTARRPTRP